MPRRRHVRSWAVVVGVIAVVFAVSAIVIRSSSDARQPHFPTADSAGVPAGWVPKESTTGDVTITAAGDTVEDLRITNGTLIINAPNVTVRRVQILGGGISNFEGPRCQNGLVIEDTTIARAPGQVTSDADLPVISAGGYTARRVLIDGVAEGFRVGGVSYGCGPVVIEDSYASIRYPDVCGDWHGDGIQGYDGPALTVRNTVIELIEKSGCGGTAPFFYPSNQGNTSVTIDGLLVKGGGYVFRLGTSGTVRGLKIVNNTWGYAPIDVKCSALSAWDAQIVLIDPQERPMTVRELACDTESG